VSDLDTSLVKQIFDIAQRQREPNLEHHRQADDLWARFEVAEGGTHGHPAKLEDGPAGLKQSSSDSAVPG
jgi:hypothetical protein